MRQSDNIKTFAENELNIAPENLLHFGYHQKNQQKAHLTESAFDRIAKKYHACLNNTYSLIFGDKTKLNAIEKERQRYTEPSSRLLFIQEFDVVRQKLKMKQIAKTDTNIRAQDIKKIIAKDDVSIFYLVDSNDYNYDSQDSDDSDLDEEVVEIERLVELPEHSVLHLYKINFSSIIYQVSRYLIPFSLNHCVIIDL